jgi:hypothetical protein
MRTLKLLLTVQAVQLLAIIWLSLLVGSSAVPIKFLGIQGDFYDFHDAGRAVLLGDNPYDNPRFNKPTSSLPLLSITAIFPRPLSVIFWFALNVWVAAKSLSALSRRLNIDCKFVYAVALTYYPMMFALARGNLDVLMLSLVVWSLSFSESKRGALVGAATALKLYTGLLTIIYARRRQWAAVFASIVTVVAFSLLVPHLLIPSIRAIVSRGQMEATFENLSPAVVLSLLPFGKLLFVGFWIITLAFKLSRDMRLDDISIIEYFPWMIAFPFVVYPYELVFLLPVMMLYAHREPSKLAMAGLILTGFQSEYVASLAGGSNHAIALCHIVNSLGLLLVITAEAARQHAKASEDSTLRINRPAMGYALLQIQKPNTEI